jgi:signal transduction histidine kinase
MAFYKRSVYYKDSIYTKKSAIEIENAELRSKAVAKDRELVKEKLNISEAELKSTATGIKSKTLWIYGILITSALILMIGGILIYIINEKKKRFEIRNEIAKDLHDDIGTGLSSITMSSEAVARLITQNNLDRAENILVQNIWVPAADMLTEIQDIIWAVNPNNAHFEQLIQRIREKCSTICSSGDVSLNLKFDHRLKNLQLDMFQQKNIYLICREAISNAVKHSSCKTVRIEFSKYGSGFILKINDDGKGFDIVKVHTGNGLKNMKKRSEELKSQFQISSLPSGGTSLSMQLYNL